MRRASRRRRLAASASTRPSPTVAMRTTRSAALATYATIVAQCDGRDGASAGCMTATVGAPDASVPDAHDAVAAAGRGQTAAAVQRRGRDRPAMTEKRERRSQFAAPRPAVSCNCPLANPTARRSLRAIERNGRRHASTGAAARRHGFAGKLHNCSLVAARVTSSRTVVDSCVAVTGKAARAATDTAPRRRATSSTATAPSARVNASARPSADALTLAAAAVRPSGRGAGYRGRRHRPCRDGAEPIDGELTPCRRESAAVVRRRACAPVARALRRGASRARARRVSGPCRAT